MARVATGSAGSRTNRKFLIVAILFGALTAVLFYAVTSRGGNSSSSTASGGDVQVVVAKAIIPQRTTITASMLEVKNVPLSATAAGYFGESAALVGKVTRFPVTANQQITADDVLDPAPGASGLSGVVPVGQRAISIQASQVISAGGLIVPGDFVDLVWSWPKTDPLTSKTVLRNVQVAAVDQAIVNEALAPAGSATPVASTSAGVTKADAVTLTLLLNEQDAQKIFLAEQTGTIRAAIRNKGDQDLADTGVADIGQLVPLDIARSLPPELRPNFKP